VSIIRFSCLKEDLFAPDGKGNWVSEDFDPARQTGLLGSFVPPAFKSSDSPLASYPGHALETAAD
jgi:hypothetical protein